MKQEQLQEIANINITHSAKKNIKGGVVGWKSTLGNHISLNKLPSTDETPHYNMKSGTAQRWI